MQTSEKLSALEAVLFAFGEPTEMSKLCEALDISKAELDECVRLLNLRYRDTESSLEVLILDDCVQLATKKEYAEYITAAMRSKRGAALSQAALEVLTVIAYNQPVTRSFIDDVRGVDSSGVVGNLLEKGLIAEAGRLDIPGKPMLFKTTENFLRCFGISDLTALPPLPTEEGQISFEEIKDTKIEG